MRRLFGVLALVVLLPTAEASSSCQTVTTIIDGRMVTCYVCRYGSTVIVSPCLEVGS